VASGLSLIGALGCSDSKEPASSNPISFVDAGKDATPEGGTGGSAGERGDGGFEGPTDLAETGLYTDLATRTLSPGVIPFDVRYRLWTDGADDSRYLLLPEGTKIDTSRMDWWRFPIGTKVWKEFWVDGKTIETRLLEKQREPRGDDSGWLMVSYAWNEAGTAATAVPAGVKDALGTSYDIPSVDDCHQCHDGVGDVVIGASAILLSAADGNGTLSKLAADGLLSDPPAAEFSPPGEGVVQDALGWLHVSCGNCHNSVHGLSFRALRLRLRVDELTPEETLIYTTSIGGQMSHMTKGTTIGVVPGKPLESQLYVRLTYRDREDFMPPLATELLDLEGMRTIEQWILGLSP
jgi:hypothetical protein